jgi:hypothetical protein
LKPERWGSPLVEEKYREEQACDKRRRYNNNNNNNNNNNELSAFNRFFFLPSLERCAYETRQQFSSVLVPLSHGGTRNDLLLPISARKLATCA